MLRLSGQDAYFLYQETQTTPMHTLKILVGRHTGERVPGFAEMKQAIAASLDAIPGFRRRIVWVPFGLHHPVAIEDPEFDINLHVHRLAAPVPGGSRELDEVIARISSHPLDHSRPLWELWMIEGLAGGRIAYVAKVHHAIADGQAAVNQLERVLGVGNREVPAVPASDPIAGSGTLSWAARSVDIVDAPESPEELSALLPPRLTSPTTANRATTATIASGTAIMILTLRVMASSSLAAPRGRMSSSGRGTRGGGGRFRGPGPAGRPGARTRGAACSR